MRLAWCVDDLSVLDKVICQAQREEHRGLADVLFRSRIAAFEMPHPTRARGPCHMEQAHGITILGRRCTNTARTEVLMAQQPRPKNLPWVEGRVTDTAAKGAQIRVARSRRIRALLEASEPVAMIGPFVVALLVCAYVAHPVLCRCC